MLYFESFYNVRREKMLRSYNRPVNLECFDKLDWMTGDRRLEAHKRGVKVQVILDKSQRTEKYSSATFLRNVGIPTFSDDKHAIAHNKVMVIDGQTGITASFDFTKTAEQFNAENLLVIDDARIAQKYAKNWRGHLEHSMPCERKDKTENPWGRMGRIMAFSVRLAMVGLIAAVVLLTGRCGGKA